MIALFAALGGGYALAFSGSGSLQKAAVDHSLGTDFENVRTLTGFGELQARCAKTAIEIRFNNTSGSLINFRGEQDNDDAVFQGGTNAGDESDPLVLGGSADPNTTRMHVWKTNVGNKDQLDITISHVVPQGDCLDGQVIRIMVLNTRQ